MKPISIKKLALALGVPCEDEKNISHISTDSRDISPGCVFVCIEGERFDGHSFAQRAIEQGAAYVVAHSALPLPPERVFYVENTMDANIAIGGAYREQFSPLSVGITGSVGKTTTKEFVYSVMEKKYKTLKTSGNHNNEIGVPKTLLELDESYEAMVIEMGMNKEGDIDKLSRAVLPDIGVITNIGTSHIERLGSRKSILGAKLEIINSMKEGSPLIICADNDLLRGVVSDKVRIVRYGIDGERLDIAARDIGGLGESTSFEIVYSGGSVPCQIPAMGRHNVYNALAAFAAGLAANIPPGDIIAGLADFKATGQRQKIVNCGGFTVVEDCYNASPDSMNAALCTLSQMECRGRRIAVLGDMLELGHTSADAHFNVGRSCAENGIDRLLTYGPRAEGCAAGAKAAGLIETEHFSDAKSLAKRLRDTVSPGDIVWFKASRGIELEKVIELFRGEQ